MEGVDREGATGRGRWGVAMGREGKDGGQAHRMPGWNEVTVFSDFVYPCNAGYPS